MTRYGRLLAELVCRDPATGDRPAIVDGDVTLSYRQLWGRVQRITELLTEKEVRSGDQVGLYFTRSADYVVSLLATLGTGAVAVPIDADLPGSRVSGILAAARPRLVLHSSAEPPAGRRCFDVRDLGETTAPGLSLGSPARPGWSTQPAFILFTSGSTGLPKGVVLHHAGIANRLLWGHDRYGIHLSDRVLHKASIGFDAAIHEIMAPLIAGAALVVAPPGLQFDSLGLVRFMRDKRITTAHFVPSVLRYVVDEPELAECTAMRRVFCGGEALDMRLVHAFRKALPTRLFNQYGPAEASLSVTYWDCDQEYDGAIAPLGYPIANVRCYVLGDDLEPLPPGRRGELWISGVAVGSGYLSGEQCDAERFRTDPFAPGGGLMYRTGDLVRQAPAGFFEFLGRTDDQVKIRGVRVAPEEVAVALREHPLVHDAVVAGITRGPGDAELVAYVQARPRNSPVADGYHRVPLPGGLAVVSPSPDEARFLHQQIFEGREYDRFGITIPAGAVVLDIGANIGLFALWAAHRAAGVTVYAVEPNPDVLPYLTTNMRLYDVAGEVIPVAITDTAGHAELTSFRELTHLSGLGARREAATRLVRSHYATAADPARSRLSPTDIDSLHQHAQERLATTSHVVETIDLGTLFDRHGIGIVDLLKINIEGSEVAALSGLHHDHWRLVRQVCVEVERASEAAAPITELLKREGFRVRETADWNVGADADVRYLYAVRPDAPLDSGTVLREPEPMLTAKVLRGYLGDRLPSALLPGQFVFLEQFPRLANGKVARLDLPAGGLKNIRRLPPGNDLREQAREIWRQVLNAEAVTDDDNFHLLGGHSLLALRIAARVRNTLGLEVSPATCLNTPTFLDWITEVGRAARVGNGSR